MSATSEEGRGWGKKIINYRILSQTERKNLELKRVSDK